MAMTIKKYIKLYGEAVYKIYVCPLLKISISMLGKQWAWQVIDINGTKNGRSWYIDGREGYDTIQEAAKDAEESYLRHEKLFSKMKWQPPTT